MLSRPTSIKVGSALIALTLAAAGCTSSKSGADNANAGAGPPSMSHSQSAGGTGTDATSTAAAGLRAALDELFREHVDLTGFVVQTAVVTGIDSDNTAQALKALDGNTVALGKAVGSIYGQPAQTAFVKMWRAHIGFFVSYTKGLATGDDALVRKAQRQLAGYKKDFAHFLGSATGLPSNAVAADLQGHITTLEDAIQAIVKKDPSAAAKLSMAESHMAGTAAVLAKGIATQMHLS